MRIVIAFCLLFPFSGFAVDGVLEINQSCINTGCFDGDTAGLPITLANSGSYRLTSNIIISAYPSPQNLTAISVTADNVSIDMNGFAIIGSTTCTGLPVSSCSPLGNGLGIHVNGGRGLAISNGQVRGMGGDGIYCSYECRISGVIAVNNGGSGIVSAQQAIITASTANRNGANGFSVTGLVFNSVAESNGGDGLQCIGCSVSDSSFVTNKGSGISFLSSSAYGGNRMRLNTGGNIVGTALATAPNLCEAAACP